MHSVELLAYSITLLLVAFVFWILYVIAYWKIFTKGGQPGWKALIPIYNTYICYKVSWNAAWPFWVFMGCAIADSVITNTYGNDSALMMVAGVLSLATFIIHIVQCNKLSKAFGHGLGYTLGLILLKPFFMMGLGFGSSAYRGAQD